LFFPAGPLLPLGNSTKVDHLPSLNEFREISIAHAPLFHLNGTVWSKNLTYGIGNFFRLDVVVFFVFSGFLITHLLHSERRKNGRLPLKPFCERRASRLLPAGAHGRQLSLQQNAILTSRSVSHKQQ